ncbi:MAG TPA: MlaD family protein [Candidatus Didemnitutus sp.]|nr:MlaD family protein [Candidatus Didemnitutus sp.]
MKTKLSPAVVGMFVLGALVLGVVGFLSFGGSNIFSKPSRFVVFFDESVSGLDPGASVKVNGVRIGRVAAINVRYDAGSKKALVETICEIDRNVLTDPDGRTIDLTSPTQMQTLIDRGLRARLNLTGITGLLFVELDFEDPKQYPAKNSPASADRYPVIPAIQSPIAELQASIVEIVANIKKVDFIGLSKDIRTLVATTNKKVDEADLKGVTDHLSRAADSVTALLESPDAKKTFANLNATIDQLRTLVTRIDSQVGPVSDDLKKTLAEAQTSLKTFNTAVESLRRFVQAQSGLGTEATRALQEVAEAADAVERLADFLERNPNALVVGKKKQ